MSKSEDDLSPQEWQARHDAACAIVTRKYCDLFGFWRRSTASRFHFCGSWSRPAP